MCPIYTLNKSDKPLPASPSFTNSPANSLDVFISVLSRPVSSAIATPVSELSLANSPSSMNENLLTSFKDSCIVCIKSAGSLPGIVVSITLSPNLIMPPFFIAAFRGISISFSYLSIILSNFVL